MIKIKRFGNDTEVKTISDALTALNGYRGKSVSIVLRKLSGIKHIVYADIAFDGTVIDSYNSDPIDETSLRALGNIDET